MKNYKNLIKDGFFYTNEYSSGTKTLKYAWGCSSGGRASVSLTEGQRFESAHLHSLFPVLKSNQKQRFTVILFDLVM